MNNNDDQALEAWGFTDEVVYLKFYTKPSRTKKPEDKIAAVKATLRLYVGTALRTFFKAANLTSMFAERHTKLATGLPLLQELVDHLIAMGNPLPAESVAGVCSKCNDNLAGLVAGLKRVTDRPQSIGQDGTPLWFQDEHGNWQPQRDESTLDRLNAGGIDGKSFSGIMTGVHGQFNRLIDEIEQFLDSGATVTYDTLCAHLDAKGLLRKVIKERIAPGSGFTLPVPKAKQFIQAKSKQAQFADLMPDKEKYKVLLEAVEACKAVAAQPLPPDGVNPNMAAADAENHIWRYNTSKGPIYLCFTDDTFATVGNIGRLAAGMTEAEVIKSISPTRKRKAAGGDKPGGGKKGRKTQGSNAPAPQVVPLPAMMAQVNLTAEMARLGIQLPFYVQAIDPQTRQPLVAPATGQPVMEERWRNVVGFNSCALTMLLRRDHRLQTALNNREPHPAIWENALRTLAGQLARLRNSATYGFTPITYNGIENHHLHSLALERGLQLGNSNPLGNHDANGPFLETAHASSQALEIETTAVRITMGGMLRAPNHFMLLEPMAAANQWGLFDPLQQRADGHPYLMPLTTAQVRAALVHDNALVTATSNVQVPQQEPGLDAIFDADFLAHNPNAWSAVIAQQAANPLVFRGGYHGGPSRPLSDNKPNGYLRAAVPVSHAPVENWPPLAKVPAALGAEAITHIVMQLENDSTVLDAASNLYQKHADTARLLQANPADGTTKEISPPTAAATAEDLKVLVVGHSRVEGADNSTTETFAGQTADSLAAMLAPRLQEWKPAQVNVVGCKTRTYIIRFAAALRHHGIMVPVVGYDGWLKVEDDGHKRITTNETAPQPANGHRICIEPAHAIFEKIPEKDVLTANQLRKQLLDLTRNRQDPSFLKTTLAEASQPHVQGTQSLYFLDPFQNGAVFAGQKDGKGYLVYATETELLLSGINAATLQRGDKVAHTPGRPVLAPNVPLRQNQSSQPDVQPIPTHSGTKGVKR